MIGKTLYKARVKDNQIVIETKTVIGESRDKKRWKFSKTDGCLKSDIGVVVFLTKKDAMEFLIKRFRRSIKMGELYVSNEKLLLAEALNFPEK